ncbi:hypothetical protein EYF80_022777 [Liparis tanakae]|uniref:Uncharacterized protein n=1 Tax=Liparis tanakae TaxID=230148 RepID=A0A4Z2HPW6_9TELE|nr:hypothetical protein EYF80_022777 [Liparis tanakae]
MVSSSGLGRAGRRRTATTNPTAVEPQQSCLLSPSLFPPSILSFGLAIRTSIQPLPQEPQATLHSRHTPPSRPIITSTDTT